MFLTVRIERIVFALIGILLVLCSFSAGCGVGTNSSPSPNIEQVKLADNIERWRTFVNKQEQLGFELMKVPDTTEWVNKWLADNTKIYRLQLTFPSAVYIDDVIITLDDKRNLQVFRRSSSPLPHKPEIRVIPPPPPPPQWSVFLDSVTVRDWTTYVASRNAEGYKLLDVGKSAVWLKENGRNISINTNGNQSPFRPVIKLTRTYTSSTGVRVDKVLIINDDEGEPRVFKNF